MRCRHLFAATISGEKPVSACVQTGSEQDESGSGVNDTRVRRQDLRVAVLDCLVNTEIVACRRGGSNGPRSWLSVDSGLLMKNCTYTALRVPLYLVLSAPPNESSPLVTDASVVGWK